MIHLVTGGSGSGKSAYAETLACRIGQKRIYLATMQPYGREGRARIERHRAMRLGKGFETAEEPCALDRLSVPEDACVLLEDVPNLTANLLFGAGEGRFPDPGGEAEEARTADAVLLQIRTVAERCSALVAVTGEVFSDGLTYSDETTRYMRILARINRALAASADTVTEVVCGIPLVLKGSKMW